MPKSPLPANQPKTNNFLAPPPQSPQVSGYTTLGIKFMAIIIIPTKIVPGCVLGAGLAGASMFTGLTSGVLFYAPQKIKLLHFLCYPIFVGILILIKKAWSTPKSRDKIVELNPKIFAVIAAICVIVGVATGVAVSSLMK